MVDLLRGATTEGKSVIMFTDYPDFLKSGVRLHSRALHRKYNQQSHFLDNVLNLYSKVSFFKALYFPILKAVQAVGTLEVLHDSGRYLNVWKIMNVLIPTNKMGRKSGKKMCLFAAGFSVVASVWHFSPYSMCLFDHFLCAARIPLFQYSINLGTAITQGCVWLKGIPCSRF